MENCYRFYRNLDCRYFPCHEGIDAEDFNCMFCYCPFYLSDRCPGDPAYWRREDGTIIKDCTACTFPHRPESYEVINRWISVQNRKRTFCDEIRAKARPVRDRKEKGEHS